MKCSLGQGWLKFNPPLPPGRDQIVLPKCPHNYFLKVSSNFIKWHHWMVFNFCADSRKFSSDMRPPVLFNPNARTHFQGEMLEQRTQIKKMIGYISDFYWNFFCINFNLCVPNIRPLLTTIKYNYIFICQKVLNQIMKLSVKLC